MIDGGPFVLVLLVLISFLCCLIGLKPPIFLLTLKTRAQQQKALTGGQSLLALTDQDEAWGTLKPSDNRSSKDAIISDPVTVKQEETEPSKASSARASLAPS